MGLDKINVYLSVTSSHLGWGKVLYATLPLPPCATRCPHHPFPNQREEQARHAISRLRQRCTSCSRKDAPRRLNRRRFSLPSSPRLETSETNRVPPARYTRTSFYQAGRCHLHRMDLLQVRHTCAQSGVRWPSWRAISVAKDNPYEQALR